MSYLHCFSTSSILKLRFWPLLVFVFSGIFFTILSVTFPISYIDSASDLGNYYKFWLNLDVANFYNIIDGRFEPGFAIFSKFCSYFISFSDFIWLINFLLFYSFFILSLKFNKNVFLAVSASLTCYFLFLPFNQLANIIIRQGLATVFLFFYLSTINLECISLRTALSWFILLISFHYSAIFVLLSLILFFNIKGMYAFYFWCLASFLYVFDITGHIGLFVYKKMDIKIIALDAFKIDPTLNYIIGFKPIFLFVSMFFVIAPMLLSTLGLLKIPLGKLLALPIFRLYFILNLLSTFMSLMPFCNRFFTWSWVIGPLLIVSSLNYLKFKKLYNN